MILNERELPGDIDRQLLAEVSLYLDEHYQDDAVSFKRARPALIRDASTEASVRSVEADFEDLFLEDTVVLAALAPESVEEALENLDESFSQKLLRLIDVKGKNDVDVYKAAHLDRRLFSKIRKDQGYTPGKRTVIALALALELSLEEAEALLRGAGYALSRNQKFDVIVEYFLVNGIYDVFTINEVLFYYDQPLIGA